MKKSLLIAILTISLISISVVAQEELPKPFLLPDHPLYGFSRWFEKVRMFFTFDESAKAKLNLYFAELRIAEAKSMIEKGKHQYAESLLKDYESELNESQNRLQAQIKLGRNVTDLAEVVANATHKHLAILEEIFEKVPEAAQPAIERAINASSKGCIIAVERIRVLSPERAENIASKFAEEELNKSVEMIKKGKEKHAQKRLEIYKELLNETEKTEKEIEGLGRNVTDLAEHVCNMTYKHVEVLEKVLAEVPERAKPAIERAINASIERQATCVERILKAINKSEEEKKWKACSSDEDCKKILAYCPEEFGFEVKCYVPKNKTEGTCYCWPKWRKVEKNCSSDADCKDVICPMVIGSDTPICKEGKCVCGAKWEIMNKTELRERLKIEIPIEIQKKVEEIYNKTEIGKIKEKFPQIGEK
jgi:rubrerythrin